MLLILFLVYTYFCIFRYLGLDLVVRDTDGNLIDVDATGVIDLYKRVSNCQMFC